MHSVCLSTESFVAVVLRGCRGRPSRLPRALFAVVVQVVVALVSRLVEATSTDGAAQAQQDYDDDGCRRGAAASVGRG